MAAITENIFGRSNRRRCVKGRISYTDTSDIVIENDEDKLENEIKDTENHLEHGVNENLDDVDEVDEEPVTIDLFEFLNENPILTEPSENVTDSAGVLTDCHSQFRVTSSLADPSPLAVEAMPSLKDLNINENITPTEDFCSSESISQIPPTVLKEDNTTVLSTDLAKVEDDKSPRKESLLNGFKPSPNKNFKSKPTIVSNLLEKYKNFSRLKDFNKNNLKVFGKYPIIKCEKLDIENFVKKSNIKVGNWPMQSINSQSKNKSLSCKTSLNKITKTPVRKLPKLLNKPISFNRGLSNSRNVSTVKKAQSILIDALKSNSSPLIIKTDNWKPEIANLSDHSAHFDNSAENFRIPVPQSFNKSIGNHRIIKLVHQKSPLLQMKDSGTQNQKLPIITSVNKVANRPKTFQLISPNTFVGAKSEKNKTVTPILPKPSSGSIISPVLLKDYTVIQPYVEDPTSPIRPKPLLTVPLDIVPVVDTFNQQGTVTAVPEVHQIIKPPTKSKPFQSVFLDGAIKQTSSPVKISKELPSVNLSDVSHCNTEIPANFVEDKIEEQLKDDTSTITPKFAVVDAMESAFVKPEIKKSPKLKQNLNKQNQLHIDLATHSECQAYNSTLNDMLFGFSDTGDFTDENCAVSTTIDISLEVCNSNTMEQSSDAYQSDLKDTLGTQHKNSECREKNHKSIKLFPKHKLRRKAIASPHDSDTLSASEGEDDKSDSPMKSSYVSTRKHKISQTPEKSLNLGIVSEESDIDLSPKKLILDAEVTEKVISQNKRNRIQRRNSSNIPTKHNPKLADQSKDKKSESNTLNSKSFIERSSINLKSKDDNSQNNTKNIGKNSNSVNKTERLRGKLKAVKDSKGNINNSCDKRKSALKCQRHIVPIIKGKRMVYVRPKFKISTKKSRNANIVNKKTSTPDDIINEVNTITSSILISSKGSRKREKAIPLKETNVNNPDLPVTKTKNDSKARTAKQNKKNLPVRSKTKKNKTLKVLFKRTTPRRKSKSLEMPFEEICHTMLNDKKNALLGNNTNLDSSFRDTKNHKVGTSSKEENKSNVEILCNNLKSDDSLKENICSKDKILSNEVSISNITEDSKNIDNEDLMNHENCSNSDLQEIKLTTKKQENASEIEDFVTLTPKENGTDCLTENIDDTPEDLVCLESKDGSEIKNIDVPINKQNTVNKDLENNGIAPCNEIHSEDHISNDAVTQSDTQDNLIILPSEEINKTNTTSDEIQSNVHSSNMVIKSDVEDKVVSVQYENANEVSVTFDGDQNQENGPDKAFNVQYENANEVSITFGEDQKQENSHDKAFNVQCENTNEVSMTFDEDQKQENSHDKAFNVQCENANGVSATFDEDQKQENSPEKAFNVQYENANGVSATFDEDKKQENSLDNAFNVQFENANEISITSDEDQKQENSPNNTFNVQCENADEVSMTFDEDQKQEKSSEKAFNVQYENTNEVSATFDEDKKQENCLDNAFNVQFENANEVSNTFDEDQKQENSPDKAFNENANEVSTTFDEDQKQENSSDKTFKANVDDNKLNMLPKDAIELNDALVVKKSDLGSELLPQTNAEDSAANSDSMNTSEIVTTCEETPRHDLDSNCVVADINGNENEIFNINEPNKTKILTPLPEKDMSSEVSKKRDPKIKRKSCPKIKISVAKPSNKSDLISNSKNWYISERKDSTDSSNSEETTKQNECGNSENIGNAMSTSVLVKNFKENTLSDEIGNESENGADQMSVNDVIPLELINVATSPDKSICASSPCVTDGTSVIEKDTDIPDVIMSSANISDNTDSELPVLTSENSVSEKSFVSSSERLISEEKADSVASSLSFKIKEESIDINESSILNCTDPSIANIKLEKEETPDSLNEISSHPSHVSPSGRNKLHNTVSHKHLKTHPESTANSGAIHDSTRVNKKTKSKKNVLLSTSTESATAPLSKISKHLESEISKMPAPARRQKGKHFSPEAVIVPFSLGWMRELVHRSTEAREGKRMSDVYYFSPEGTKLRSMPEIANYLSKHPECKLTLENFTFWKECVYREPFEIERSAKHISVSASSSKKETPNQTSIKKFLSSSTTSKSNLTPNESKEKTSKHSLSKKSSVTMKELHSSNSINDSDNIVRTNSDNKDFAKSKVDRKRIKKIPFDNSQDNKPQLKSSTKIKQKCSSTCMNTSVPDVKVKKTVTVQNQLSTVLSNSEKNSLSKDSSLSKCSSRKKRPKFKIVLSKSVDSAEIQCPCTPHCVGASIQPPSVQCAICLCLFHAHCIPKLAEKVIFACRPCTTQKLALYENERKSVVFPRSVSSDEVSTCDHSDDVDVSLLLPEIILSVPCERDTFSSNTGSDIPYKSFNSSNPSSNIPHEQEKTAFFSESSNLGPSTAVENVNNRNSAPLHMDNSKSAPCLLSNLLQPNAPRKPNVIPIIRCTSNQILNYPPSQLTVVNANDFPSRVYHVGYGVRLPPGINISLENSLIIRRLPDGRRAVIRRNSNSSNSRNNVSSSPDQKPATAVHSNHQLLSDISGYVNTSFVHTNTNKTLTKSFETQNNTAVKSTIVTSKESVKPCLLNYVRNEKNGSITLQFLESSRKSGTSLTQSALYLVFKKLNVSDLLRARQVCSHWRDVASQNDLWEKVSLNGLTITNWKRCCFALQKFGTKSLDLRGIVHQNTVNMWEDLKKHIMELAGIQELIFDQITPSLLKSVAYNVPLLRKLECHFVTNACTEPEIWTTSCDVQLSSLRCLGRLVRLKIGSGASIILRKGGEYFMPYLPNLRHVTLTGFNFSSPVNLESLAQQKELISLELGDCKDIEPGIYGILGTLTKLKRLRLENGGDVNDSKLCEALLKIKGLEVLELMNFKIPKNLVDSFKELQHLIHVSIWPDNTFKSAVVNKNLFTAISNCKDLKYLCWGIIAEGEFTPKVLEMEDSDELTFEDLFNRLVALFPECRVEVKSVSRNLWKKFCSTRK